MQHSLTASVALRSRTGVASYIPLVILAIWNGTKTLLNKIDNKFCGTEKCVLPSTWIVFITFSIFCVLILLSFIINFFEHPTIYLGDISVGALYSSGLVCLISLYPSIRPLHNTLNFQ